MLCQKEPQDDGWGGEGGTEGNIGGEVGSSITLIPPDSKNMFCRHFLSRLQSCEV